MPFLRRLEAFRVAWEDQRLLNGLKGEHSYQAQFYLLSTLHTFAVESATTISRIYGEAPAVVVSPRPEAGKPHPAFTVVVAERHVIQFALHSRAREGVSNWSIGVSLWTAHLRNMGRRVYRQSGVWSRRRVEDLILSALATYEHESSDLDMEEEWFDEE